MARKTVVKPSTSRLIPLLFALCVGFILFLSFYHLGQASFENWDEAWYAEATKEMLQTKDFIVLRWNHTLWLDKPPLYIWISALISSVIGLSEFSMRVTSAVSGAILMILITVISYRSYGLVPSILALSSLSLNNLFIWRTRSGNIDVFVSLLIFLTYLLMQSKYKSRYPLLGILFACIYLTKASLVFFPLLVFVMYELFYKWRDIKKQYQEYLKLFALFAVICGTWLFLGSLEVGHDFISYYLFKSDQGVASVSFMHLNQEYLSYAYYALQRRFFWVLLLGTGFAIVMIKQSRNFLLLGFAWLLLIQLSFTQRNNNWYLIPSMPFWSLLIALGTAEVLKLTRKHISVIVLILLATSYVSYRTFIANVLPILDLAPLSAQAESSKALNKLSKPGDIVIRMDHLYPTTIYYTDRQVITSPPEAITSTPLWISRVDLLKSMQEGKVKWLIGTNSDLQAFKDQTDAAQIPLILRKINAEETIGEVTP